MLASRALWRSHMADFERALLGALLLEPERLTEVRAVGLRPEHFSETSLRSLFADIQALSRKGIPVETLTLSQRGASVGLLVELRDAVATAANATFYAEQVRARGIERLTQGAIREVLQERSHEVGIAIRVRRALDELQCPDDRFAPLEVGDHWRIAPEVPALMRAADGRIALPAQEVAILAGATGVGKSRLALSLCVSIAHGGPWYSWRPTKTGRALYVGAETSEVALRRRLAQIAGDFPDEVDPAVRNRLAMVSLRGQRRRLMEKGDETPVFFRLLDFARRFEPDLIVLDTAGAMGPQGFEEDQSAADDFVRILERLTSEVGATVLLLHHTVKSQWSRDEPMTASDIRGAGALVAAAQWSAGLFRSPEGALHFQVLQANETATGLGFQLEMSDRGVLRERQDPSSQPPRWAQSTPPTPNGGSYIHGL